MFQKISHFLKDDDFQMILQNHNLYIKNYQKLISLEEDYISFFIPKKRLFIRGKNLSLKKILDFEVLIQGTIEMIEVKDER